MKSESRHFSVNGVEREWPNAGEGSFAELMTFIRRAFISDASCISSIRVDGEEISEAEETAYGPLPLSEIRTVEIFTAHPRELAEETIQNLLVFTDHLAALSREAGTLFKAAGHPSLEFAKLVDGIQTFTDAMSNVKQILRARNIPQVEILETDLVSIMKDLLDFYEQGQIDYVVDLLCEHLPKNMEDWRNDGLPALIRARDS